MFYYASKIISAFIWPSSVITIMLVVGIALLVIGRAPMLGRRLSAAGIALYLLCGLSPLGNIMTFPLEERFVREPLPQDLAGIIMLGGFERGSLTTTRRQLSLNESAERLTEGLKLAHERPRAKLIFTGGDGVLMSFANNSIAGPIGEYLQSVGIPRERLILEGDSRTTWENALFLHRMLAPKAGERYALVTSAFHMPRSVGAFRQVGFDVVAWPVDYRTRGPMDAFATFTAVTSGLEAVDLAFKEWIGLLAYRLTGRTSALWPAPSRL